MADEDEDDADDADEEDVGPPTPEEGDEEDDRVVCLMCNGLIPVDEYVAHLTLHVDVFPSILLVMGPQGVMDIELRMGGGDAFELDYEFLTELGDQIGNVPRGFPTPEARARVMNGFTVARSDGTLCVVCQDALRPDTDVVELLCGHLYCRGCIDEWLAVSKRCPVCSADMGELLAPVPAPAPAEVD